MRDICVRRGFQADEALLRSSLHGGNRTRDVPPARSERRGEGPDAVSRRAFEPNTPWRIDRRGTAPMAQQGASSFEKKKLYNETVGCQMNLLDSELVVAKLRQEGYELTEDIRQADTILYNTCSV